MKKIRVASVKYINSYPFMLGLRDGKVASLTDVEVFHPSECADRVIQGQSDIGLMPVAAIASMQEYHIVSDYCLSTNGEVRTVLLVSNDPLEEVKRIFLDFRSRSSVALCRIFAARLWHREFEWLSTTEDFDITAMKHGEAAVMIGDRCFEYARLFRYRIDFGLEWKRFTGLPFVFACWISSKELDESFTALFNKALGEGVRRKNDSVSLLPDESVASRDEVIYYLNNNIDFYLNDDKRKAISMFINYIKELNLDK